MNKIYLDANATCLPLPKAMEAYCKYMSRPLNASSVHQEGRFAKKLLEEARIKVATALNAKKGYQVVFTATGTEANNLAIKGFPQHTVMCSEIEHKSVLQVVGKGMIPVDQYGKVKLEALELLLINAKKPVLVSIIYANNETGIIQDIKLIAQLVHKYEGILHTDASQAFGKIPVDIMELGVDLITITAHKIGGMHGAAALVFRKDLPIQPLILGGGQESRFRSGTQDIHAIHAFGVVAEGINDIIQSFQRLKGLRDEMEAIISGVDDTVLYKNIRTPQKLAYDSQVLGAYGTEDRSVLNIHEDLSTGVTPQLAAEVEFMKSSIERLPNTSSIYMPNVSSEAQVIYFDLQNVMISAGSACSSGTISVPYVYLAMGVDSRVAANTIRISLHPGNSRDEIQHFIKLWRELYENNNIKELKRA